MLQLGQLNKFLKNKFKKKKKKTRGKVFPDDQVVKNPPANTEDTGSIPGPRRAYIPEGN